MSSVKLITEISESEYFYYSLKKVAINYYTDTISKYNAGQLIKCFSQIRPTLLLSCAPGGTNKWKKLILYFRKEMHWLEEKCCFYICSLKSKGNMWDKMTQKYFTHRKHSRKYLSSSQYTYFALPVILNNSCLFEDAESIFFTGMIISIAVKFNGRASSFFIVTFPNCWTECS